MKYFILKHIEQSYVFAVIVTGVLLFMVLSTNSSEPKLYATQHKNESMPVSLGIVKTVQRNVVNGFNQSTIINADGQSYVVSGSVSGFENTPATFEYSYNNQKQICGGRPRSCYLLVNSSLLHLEH